MENIEKKIINIFKEQPGLFGKKNMLSNMADWNPAEIIGVKPYPLAISLYKSYCRFCYVNKFGVLKPPWNIFFE